ncbi:MAG TPA: PASTA domain-containing protein [Gemmatimonadaceae bacterium]|nr:PASTA domain-containing protein [Gemmatimonadaceae bacterium]
MATTRTVRRAALIAAAALTLLGTGEAAATTFTATGAEQTYVVPAGVTYVDVTAVGARGGDGTQYGVGGRGASVSARLAVSPGQALYVHVGGAGADGEETGLTVAGGDNGGGRGAAWGGAGGGGASDVRTVPAAAGPSSLASRLVVAAGGGGATPRGDGGDAGGTGQSAPVGYPGLPGGAGTASAGGAGGGTFGGDPGAAGALGLGGDGGYTGGGGGGGGLYGGGGGGGGVSGDGAGGGGGSSYVDPGATLVSGPTVTSAAASVTIEPGPAAPAPVLAVPLVASVTPGEGPVGGGTRVVVVGAHFGSVDRVLFGDVPAASFTVLGFDRLEAVAPPAARAGAVTVSVHGAGGTGTGGTFAYVGEPAEPSPPMPGHDDLPPAVAACLVPDLAGLRLPAARHALRAAGCAVGAVTRRGRPAPRVVVRQTPAAGRSLDHDARVDVTLRPRRT